ncbi:MAG TPA: nucleoside-diphosphate kinase [Methylomirabilota bacterium]|jgi:nucleoside-diphosphate kinase|nr:nucleoside-diphosphate kinase [Methylomirabilota bacterium]
MANNSLEQTLVLLKPDAIERGLVGQILERFEKVGLKIAGLKLLQADSEQAQKHYTEDLAKRRGEHVRKMMINILTSGPVVAVCLEGIEAVELVRKMVGATEPKSAQPGTIRGDYSHVSFKYADEIEAGIYNLVHASGSVEEAKTEVAVWFTDKELLKHKPSYTKHTLYH